MVPQDESEDRRQDQRLRLASSDLEDCEELWTDELGRYFLEQRVRTREIEAWFESKSLERNQEVIKHALQSCNSRLHVIQERERPIPPKPAATEPPSSMEDDSASQDQKPCVKQPSIGDTADDVARELEDLADTTTRKPRPRKSVPTKRKRDSRLAAHDTKSPLPDIFVEPAADAALDALEDEFDSQVKRPLTKRKKLNVPLPTPSFEDSIDDVALELERSVDDLPSSVRGSSPPYSNGVQTPQAPAKRKRASRKKRALADDEPFAEVGADAVDDASVDASVGSRTLSSGFYHLDEQIPEPKKGKKADHLVLARRLVALEDAQRKVWLNIARKDIPKVYRFHSQGYSHKISHHKKLSGLIVAQTKRVGTRSSKSTKDIQTRARRLTREMLLFWKKNDREEGVNRKKAEKEALEKAKAEEEKREAARQARKLEFLITQTELYSHFVGNKLKTSELEASSQKTVLTGTSKHSIDISTHDSSTPLAALDFDRDDKETLTLHAARKAQEQVAQALLRAKAFDKEAAKDRQKNEAPFRDTTSGTTPEPGTHKPLVDLDSDELNFTNPLSMENLEIQQPKMLTIPLKDYQLKGLNWLATLYEQGINGILADEMGLGKTVQSISLLAYLIEKHDIWGPFLVIAPASTLFNWQQELERFVPKMVVQDAQYFQKVNWQYMILDEAQAIKSSASARWKTLLGFPCRNRLLLTGTPIQNSMHELWALLHFIMPTLFDSHDEFNEWFSKDIESHAENKGESNLNEHQLRRLHMILKPFMLRRVKKHVQNELGDKIEIDLYCDLSFRQRALYRGLRANVSVQELLVKAAKHGDADSARSLMNLVMQFRKVCNHPDLFERADVTAPYAFCDFPKTVSLLREKDLLFYSNIAKSPISLSLPRIFYEDGLIHGIPGEGSICYDTNRVQSLINIWRTDFLADSANSGLSFLRLLRLSPGETHSFYRASLMCRAACTSATRVRYRDDGPLLYDDEFVANSLLPLGHVASTFVSRFLDSAPGLPSLMDIAIDYWESSCLSRSDISKYHTSKVVAPTVRLDISDRSFVEWQNRWFEGNTSENRALYGLPPSIVESLPAYETMQDLLPGISPRGLIASSARDQLPKSPIVIPEPKSLVTDSAKLARLDALLAELKVGGHRCLIYFQMTRMIDLMEEYMTFRKYKYLRLDGSSKLEDRRDMVQDWQTQSDIFCFLLSTRAGGLGINLTAADTVIFYDHDWNPSNDSQAMDRAHRLGQTRQVTVYRLITKGTIDERIVQLARVKKDVQDIVVGAKGFDGARTNDIASLLLNDDELAAVNERSAEGQSVAVISHNDAAIRMWHDEGDDFFAQQPSMRTALDVDVNEDVPSGIATPRSLAAAVIPQSKKKAKGRSHKKKAGPVTGDTLPEDL
ncbi:P-loop containing nucleoside triphosphate hydrolase protein [Cantharellus anzutake]|uniref:P-loop containing nucleoside triphosphate hydrolase protein n=1 Tax=Cantharellus anzutake TaxID=1750568 RepID=UPI0019049C24|nr:P-loop containing nucleoside triphosphate hydrolase protein [Cantharellus anzutake]KAF8330420.1 P-loop containing nucleoside triphosphate hydrolase protein [Cantharellus anzutake]